MLTIRPLFQGDGEREPLTLSADELNDQPEQNETLSEEDLSESSSDLNQFQTIFHSGARSGLLQRWYFTDLVTRCVLWGVKHKSETSTLPAARLFWLSGEGIPLQTWRTIRHANFIKDFVDAARFIVTGVGPTVLAGLLLHDMISYRVSDERCGNSFADILLGTATNQITWGYHFGSDVVHEFTYWTWLGALLLPPMTGIMAAFLQDRQRELMRPLDKQAVINQLSTILATLDKERLSFKEACMSLFPFGTVRTTLAQVKFMLLWDGRQNEDQSLLISLNIKEALLVNLIELAHPSNHFLIRYRALHLLTQIAASFHSDNLERFIEDPAQKAGLLQLREIILTALRAEPITESRANSSFEEIEADRYLATTSNEAMMDDIPLSQTRTRGGLARYFRWTLGEQRGALAQLFWLPLLLGSFYTLYSMSRYTQLVITKIIDLADHFQRKSACETEDKYFNFLTQSERYECVACNWSFVNYQDSFTAQGCLEGLLQQNMSAAELHHHLIQMPMRPGITRVDFSQQAWPAWAAADWEQLLLTLQSMLSTPLQLLNVSRLALENKLNKVPSQQHIHALARWLMRINVTRFDISHQVLGDEPVKLLLNSLAAIPLKELHLVDTQMTDVSAVSLANLLSDGWQNLNNLQLATNQITDLGMQHISAAVSNSSLTTLNVADNPFFDSGLQKLAKGIQASFVHTLDLSGLHFSANGLSIFSDALKENSSLTTLIINKATLSSEHVIALQSCLKNLEHLDISNNLLVDEDIQFLIKQARNSRLKRLNIAGAELSDAGAAMLAEHLPATSLQHLDISNTDLTPRGFSELVKAFPHTQLLSFTCQECRLDNQDVAELGRVFSNNTLLLRALNLNVNKITEITLLNWLEVLPKTNLSQLQLNHNEIASPQPIAQRLASFLAKTKLTFLDLSANSLDGNFFKALAPVLPTSRFQQLILNNNRVEQASLNSFVKELARLPCHVNDLDKKTISRQAKRVFYPMKPNTALVQLHVSHTDADPSSIRAFCRVASSLPDIRFLESKPMQHLDWRSCELSAAHTPALTNQTNLSQASNLKTSTILLGSPFLISLLCAGGILCLIGLLYGGYRASRSSYRFFRPAAERLPSLEAESAETRADSNLRQSHP